MGASLAPGEHPATASLDAFARGLAAPDEGVEVMLHLMRGCAACAARVARRSGVAAPAPVPPGDGSEYAFAIAHAKRVVARQERDLLRARLAVRTAGPAEGQPDGLPRPAAAPAWQLCEALMEAAHELRHQDPAVMLRLAALAACLAESLDPETGGRRPLRDLQARAWARVGNARRVHGHLRLAEESFGRAFARAAEGSGDPLPFAAIVDLAASLLRVQRRFSEALVLHELAVRIYKEYGEPHLAGRAMIKQAIVLDYTHRTGESARLVREGLGLVDGAREPQLLLYAVHYLTSLLIDGGAFARAHRLAARSRPLYDRLAGPLSLLWRRFLEGRLAAGLGREAEAARAFLEVREGFAHHGMPLDAAQVALDLAELWLRQGRTGQVLRLLDEALASFHAGGVRREAIATLLVLRRAVERERASERLLRSAAARLRRLERRPASPAPVLPFRGSGKEHR
jgi:tetratricopeptide (TPR) repeat protein